MLSQKDRPRSGRVTPSMVTSPGIIRIGCFVFGCPLFAATEARKTVQERVSESSLVFMILLGRAYFVLLHVRIQYMHLETLFLLYFAASQRLPESGEES